MGWRWRPRSGRWERTLQIARSRGETVRLSSALPRLLLSLHYACRIGSGRVADVCDGATYLLNGKDIEIDRRIPREEYLSGACFGRGPAVVYPVAAPSTSGTLTKKFVPLKPMVLNPAVVKRPSTAASSSKVALEPVGLLASTENMPARASSSKSSGNDTYWTANWSASLCYLLDCALNPVCAGGNAKTESTKHGMAMPLSSLTSTRVNSSSSLRKARCESPPFTFGGSFFSTCPAMSASVRHRGRVCRLSAVTPIILAGKKLNSTPKSPRPRCRRSPALP